MNNTIKTRCADIVIFYVDNEHYGLYNTKQQTIVLDSRYLLIEDAYAEGLFIVKKQVSNDMTWTQSLDNIHYVEGLFDAKKRKWLLECEYYCIWHFDPLFKMACITKRYPGDQSGFVNTEGSIVIPCKYNMPFWDTFDELGYMPLQIGNKWGVLDVHNNVILPFEYDNISRFYPYNHLITIKKSGLIGYVDSTYNIVISPRYKSGIDFFNAGGYWRAIVEEENKHYVIDEEGKHISIGYEDIRIRINEVHYAEVLCFSLFKGGWHWERISTLHGEMVNGLGLDRKTKDMMVKAAIWGSTAAASAAITALCRSFGTEVPHPVKSRCTDIARQNAWNKYQETDDAIAALFAMLN